MKKICNYDTTVTVRLSIADRDKLFALAAKAGVSASAMVRELVRDTSGRELLEYFASECEKIDLDGVLGELETSLEAMTG